MIKKLCTILLLGLFTFNINALDIISVNTNNHVLNRTDFSGSSVIFSNLTVKGTSEIILPISTNELINGTLWNNNGNIAIIGTNNVPYIEFSGIITPANGTATVTYAVGNMPSLTITSPTVVTLDPTGYGTNGVSRVALSLYCGTNSVTLSTNVITYATTPTLSTNCWNTILIRRVSNCVWKGVQL